MKQYKHLFLYVAVVVLAVAGGRFFVLEAQAQNGGDPKSFSSCDEPQTNNTSSTE